MFPRLAFLLLGAFLLPTAALAEPHCDVNQFTSTTAAFQKGVASGEKGEHGVSRQTVMRIRDGEAYHG